MIVFMASTVRHPMYPLLCIYGIPVYRTIEKKYRTYDFLLRPGTNSTFSASGS